MAETVSMQRTEQLHVMVELLSGLDADGVDAPQAFYDPLCEAVCRLTSMERVVLLLYDDARKLVVPAGSHGIDPGVLADVFGTLEETPLAQRALAEDRVVEAASKLEKEVPPRYARLLGLTTLTCTPVSAGGRWLGVVFADRGGGRFTLTDQERHTMWTLGKTAALAASARIATRQQQRASLLSQRIDLAREVHERVMQRLFGVSLVLGAAHELTSEERRRAGEEIQAAVADLRTAMARPIEPAPHGTGAKLRDELERLSRHYDGAPVDVSWERDREVPEDLERLAQSVLAEALRNAHKHARASRVHVKVAGDEGLFVLEVRNDGVGRRAEPARGAGMGLRLAALDALQRGGVVEFGPAESSQWRVRLAVPVPGEE